MQLLELLPAFSAAGTEVSLAVLEGASRTSMLTWHFLARNVTSATRRHCLLGGLTAAGLPSFPGEAVAHVLASARNSPAARRKVSVGPARDIKSLHEAAKVALDGDLVLVDSGDYQGDFAVWPQNDLVIRAEGPPARLLASGQSAEGKAIFVVRGTGVQVENLAFSGARVRDRNGAGIRLEGNPVPCIAC